MTNHPAVKIQNLSFTYEDEVTRALNGVNLSIEKGEFVLLVGPSGCGKSTLCLTLNGIIPHHLRGTIEGSIEVLGQNVLESSTSQLAREVQVVFQNPDEQLTSLYVEDEVAFGPENLRLPSKDVGQRVEEALDFTQLSELRSRVVYDLSGGQKQRLAIAAALAMRPRLLVMDAPTSNLDPQGVKDMMDVILKLRKLENVTTIIVEHNVDDLINLVDRLLVMNNQGRILMDGNPREILVHGIELESELGIWIPETTELYFAARQSLGAELNEAAPWLTISEAIKGLSRLSSLRAPKSDTDIYTNDKKVLEVNGLCYSYTDGKKVLDDISFQIGEGEFVALVGQNGSGKTTLALNLISILRPSRGSIYLEGRDTKRRSTYDVCRHIAYVFQYPDHQFVEDSVSKEMAMALGNSDASLIESELRKLGLQGSMNRYPYNLSLGEKRRLSVRLMTLAEPNIILLDEPTYGQDRRRCYDLMQEMNRLNAKGTTVVFITHNMRLVAEFANHVIALKDGKVVYDGDKHPFFSDRKILNELALDQTPAMKVATGLFGTPCLLSVSEFNHAMKSAKAVIDN